MQIEFENISKKYGRRYALEHFSATLEQGIYGLLGANGAGKTTLISIFVGILKKDNGTIRLDGEDIFKMGKEFLGKIGYMPQYPVFYKDFRVLEFLQYMCELKGIPKKEGTEYAEELLEIVNLKNDMNKRIGALSGGMRQRVGIVQAMLGRPEVLVLDEPTAGLDPQERIRFRNLIARFSEKRTILLATHIVSDVEFISNEVLIMKEGRLLKKDTTENLEKEMTGKVWNITLKNAGDFGAYEKYNISNMQREGGNLHLRVLSEKPPKEEAIMAAPNLEDVFLYYNNCLDGGKHDTIN